MQEHQEIQGIFPYAAREKAMDEKSQAEFQLEKVGRIWVWGRAKPVVVPKICDIR